MAKVARIFDEQTNNDPIHSLPQDRQLPHEVKLQNSEKAPWATTANGTMPPMMFQINFHDGRMICFAYSDLREIHCRDAGHIELFVQAMGKLAILIEGRHLTDLAKWLCNGMIRSIQESDPRDTKPESAPEIVNITVEELPD